LYDRERQEKRESCGGVSVLNISLFLSLFLSFFFSFFRSDNLTNSLHSGTSNRKHWNDNLNYKKILLKLDDMKLRNLDDRDGLDSYMDDLFADLEHHTSTGFRRSSYSLASEDEAERTFNKSHSIMEYVEEGTNQVRSGMAKIAKTVVRATNTVVGTTADIVVNYTPGLSQLVLPHVHGGFWAAYEGVRLFIHESLRREVTRDPAHVCFTGHSLGGALATIAAVDFKIHSVPRIDAFMKHHYERSMTQSVLDIKKHPQIKLIQVSMVTIYVVLYMLYTLYISLAHSSHISLTPLTPLLLIPPLSLYNKVQLRKPSRRERSLCRAFRQACHGQLSSSGRWGPCPVCSFLELWV
jgi:hypothetical protein